MASGNSGTDEVDPEEEKEEVTPTYATVEEFLAAVAAVGEVDTPEDLLAAIDNCLSIYNKLSPEDQAEQAEAYEYIVGYREEVAAGNPDEGIDGLGVTAKRTPKVRIMFSDGKTKPSSGYATGTSFSFDALSGTYVGQPSSYYSEASKYTFLSYSCYDGGGMGTASVTQPGDWWNPSGTIYMTINVKEDSTGKLPGSGTGTNMGHPNFTVNVQKVILGKSGCQASTTTQVTCKTSNHTSGNCFVNKSYFTPSNFNWSDTGWLGWCIDQYGTYGGQAVTNPKNDYSWQSYKDFQFTIPTFTGSTTAWDTVYLVYSAPETAYTITYNVNGGSGSVASTKTESSTNSTKYGDLSSTTPTHPQGYKFLGWSKDKEASTATYSAGQKNVGFTGNTTLYAVWDKNAENVTLTYIDRGQEYKKTSVNKGTKIEIIDCTNTRNSYDFKGWSQTNGGNVEYVVGEKITLNEDMILYAVWQKKVTDNGNGISVTKSRVSINGDASKTTAEPDDEIKWEITVTNNSNVTKTVTLTEQLPGAYFTSTNTRTVTITLEPGKSETVFAKYTVKSKDKGTTIYNTVAASTGGTGDKENPTDTDEGTEVPGTGTITLTGRGEFTVSKTFKNLPESLIPANFAISYNVTYSVDGVEQSHRESGTVSLTKNGDTYTGKITPTIWDTAGLAKLSEDERTKYKTIIKFTERNAGVNGYTHTFKPTYVADGSANADGTVTFSIPGATYSKILSLKNTYTQQQIPTTTLKVDKVAKNDKGEIITEAEADNTVKYEITVENIGTETAEGVKVIDVLDSNLEYVKAFLKVGETDRAVSKNGNEYSIGDIPAGETAVLTIETKVKSGVAVGIKIRNTATADYTNKPTGITPPSDEVDVTVGGEVLTVTKTKTSNKDEVEVGDTIIWKITIRNNMANSKTVKVEDILANASGNAIVTDANGNKIASDTGVTVAAQSTVELTASYKVLSSDAGKTIKNSVKVTDSSNPDDPVQETEDGETKVSDKTTLTIQKTVFAKDQNGDWISGGNPKAGEEVRYEITVTNGGKVTAKNVVVTDKLDSRLENPQVSLTVDRTVVDTVDKEGSNYKIGDLAAEKVAVLTITAKVKEGTPVGTEIKNTATADHTNKPDGDLPFGDANFTVGGKPLDVSKTRTSGSVAIVGDAEKGTITWDIVLTNNTASSKMVNVKDILQNASVSGATVKNGNDIVAEDTEITVPAGKSVTLTASYEVKKEDAGKTITNKVVVTEAGKAPVEDTDEGTEVKLPERKVVIKYVDADKDEADPAYLLSEESKKQSDDKPFKDGDSYDLEEWGLKKDDGSDIEEIDINDHHYIVISVEDPGNGTVDGDIEILVKCTVDDIGKGDGSDEPDGIPDKYQVVVTYRAINGTIDGPVKAIVTLMDEDGDYATAADGGKGNLTTDQIPGTSANEGYGNGTWAPTTPTVTYEITEDTEFVITYSQNATTPPGGGGGGGNNDDDDDDDPTPTPSTPQTPGPTPIIPGPVPTVGPTTTVVPTVTPVPATPVAPTPTAALTSPTPEAVALADEAVPLAAEEEKEQPEPVAVDEEETPLAGGKGAAWALINFALMNLAIFESVMLLIGYFVKTKNDEEEEKRKLKKKGIFRVISLPIAVISLIVFILTEDITLPTAFVDKYTIVMLIIAIVQTVMVALSNKKYEDEEEA